jgi:hypothetical protein
MTAIKRIWQALVIIFFGNFNFIFLLWGMNKLPFKGGAEFTIFVPFLFTAMAIKLLIYDYFYVDIKELENRIAKITFLVILILGILSIAAVIQTIIYYILSRVI